MTITDPAPPPQPPTTSSYTAFISYRHRGDRDLAGRLQNGIERFATEDRRARSVRVFRDDASMGGTPDLWHSIKDALTESGWLVLLASPESAESEWVGRELDEWHRLGRTDRLIIVLTRGTLRWSAEGNGFDHASTALHPHLPPLMTTEPRVVDARPVAEGASRREREDAFESVLADVVSTVREVDKDTIRGEHLAIQRRAVRRARTAVVGLTLLTVLALVAGSIAVWQQNVARTQARIATARALAAESDQVGDRDPILSAHLALAAYRLDPSASATAAVLHAYDRTADTDGFVEVDPNGTGPPERGAENAQALTVAIGPDGRFVAVGGYGGVVRLWDTASGRLVGTYPAEDNGNAGAPLSFSPDGRRLVTTRAVVSVPDGATIFTPPDEATITTLSPDARRVAIWAPKRGGGFVADLAVPGPPQFVVPGSDEQSRAALEAMLSSANTAAYERVRPSVRNDTHFAYTALADGAGRWATLQDGTTITVYSLVDGSVVGRAALPMAPRHGDALGMSSDGSTVLVGDDTGGVTAFDGRLGTARIVARLPGQVRDIAVTPDGSRATVSDSPGNVVQIDVRRQGPLTVLPGTPGRFVAAETQEPLLTPSPDGRLLVVADGAGASLWSLAEQRELGRVPVEPLALEGDEPVVAFSPDGSRLALRGPRTVHVLAVPSLQEVRAVAAPGDDAEIAPLFTTLLGPGANLSRSDSTDERRRSPSGHTEIADGRIVDLDEGRSVPLAGGSGPISASSFGFAAGDAVVVQSTVPTRESEIFRNRLLLWDRAGGTLLGQWEEPQSVVWPGDQADDVVVAGGTTALTIRPDGSIGQWTVSPAAWVVHLCRLAGEPSAQERQDHMALLGDEPLCSPT